MKRQCLYIIMCIFSLLALPGCRDEEAVQTSEGTRTVTVNLGIAMSRVTKGSSVGDGSTPKDMKVWIFNQDNTELVDYYEIENPTFSGSDALGELVNTHERIFELDNSITELNFYVVLNSVSGTGINLSKSSSVNDIQNATFTALNEVEGDNQVPIYGEAKLEDVSIQKKSYSVTIETTRSVSKLEMFFTKESEKSQLMINEMTLTNIPDKGFLAREATTDDASLTYSGIKTLFTGPQNIDNYLPEETTLGDFSTQAGSFNAITLSQPYLLENPYNTAWSDNGNTDYEFPQPEEADEKAYVLTVAYTLNNKEEERSFVLPETKRNIWNKIFVRVNDNGQLVIQYKALPWEKVTSGIGYAPEPISTTDSPFGGDTEYEDFLENGHHYILLPLEKYSDDYHTTRTLFNHLYENPNTGDNEARLCFLTRPTYDTNKQYIDLKTGSAGARYFFMLTGPEGATWEAHLTNEEDFAFSTSENTDFNENTDEHGNEDVRMVTHGIARNKPYIIQIIATHLYTGYEGNMSGNISEDDKGFPEDIDDWRSYFGDNYLTTWGKDKWNNEKVVETEFYITVKLTDGTEYELTINPSYSANTKIDDEKFPFKEKRRYAGTDTRIWIRQIRAQYGIENLEDLAKNVPENWWQNNPYWNTNHTW